MGSIFPSNPLVISDDGNFIALGSPHYVNGGGGVHTFTRSNNTWSFQQYIPFPDSGYFGNGMAYAEDTETLMVGGPRCDENNTNTGTIFFYHKNGSGTWTLDTQIDGQDYGDYFGGWCTISKDGMTAAWGPKDDVTSSNANRTISNEAVHVYTNDGTANGGVWTLQQRFSSSNYSESDNEKFAQTVELSDDGNTMLVAAYDKHVTIDGTAYTDIGQAYIFTRSGNTWTELGVINIPTSYVDDSREFGHYGRLSPDGEYVYLYSRGNSSRHGTVHIYEKG